MEVSKSVKPLLTILLTLILTGCLDENSAPVAADDSTILNQGRSTTIDVLQNDRDKDHDPLVV
ncbi:MAG: hypothetical protein ABW152_17725, partial [Candidatus Thiodiazotropha endolucinida]